MFAVRHLVLGHGQPRVRNRRQVLIVWGQITSLREWSGARIHLFRWGQSTSLREWSDPKSQDYYLARAAMMASDTLRGASV